MENLQKRILVVDDEADVRNFLKAALIESGFEVTPTVIGNNVHLRIVPRIAYDDNQEAVVRFFGAQTELTMPFGTWVEIGGIADQNNEVLKEILSRGDDHQRRSRTMSLMVEKP